MIGYRELAKELLKENSRNDPIPELNQNNNMGVFVVGGPASGKSSFIEDYIYKYNFVRRDFQVFSTDDISDFRAENDPEWEEKEAGKDHVPGSSGLKYSYLKHFIESSHNDNFVLDTLGIGLSKKHSQRVEDTYKLAKKEGYDVIFIHLVVEVAPAIDRIISRNKKDTQPNVDIPQAKGRYTKHSQLSRDSFGSFGEGPVGRDDIEVSYEALSTNKSQNIISYYSSLGNDPYYVVVNFGGGKRVFYKYEDRQMKIRSNYEYVPINKSSN